MPPDDYEYVLRKVHHRRQNALYEEATSGDYLSDDQSSCSIHSPSRVKSPQATPLKVQSPLAILSKSPQVDQESPSSPPSRPPKTVAQLREQFQQSQDEKSTNIDLDEETLANTAKTVAELRSQFMKGIAILENKDTSSPKTVTQIKEEFSREHSKQSSISSPGVQSHSPVTLDGEFRFTSPKYDKKMQELFDRKYRLSSQRFEAMQKQGIQPVELSVSSSSQEDYMTSTSRQSFGEGSLGTDNKYNGDNVKYGEDKAPDPDVFDASLEKLRSQGLDMDQAKAVMYDAKMQELFNRKYRPSTGDV